MSTYWAFYGYLWRGGYDFGERIYLQRRWASLVRRARAEAVPGASDFISEICLGEKLAARCPRNELAETQFNEGEA